MPLPSDCWLRAVLAGSLPVVIWPHIVEESFDLHCGIYAVVGKAEVLSLSDFWLQAIYCSSVPLKLAGLCCWKPGLSEQACELCSRSRSGRQGGGAVAERLLAAHRRWRRPRARMAVLPHLRRRERLCGAAAGAPASHEPRVRTSLRIVHLNDFLLLPRPQRQGTLCAAASGASASRESRVSSNVRSFESLLLVAAPLSVSKARSVQQKSRSVQPPLFRDRKDIVPFPLLLSS